MDRQRTGIGWDITGHWRTLTTQTTCFYEHQGQTRFSKKIARLEENAGRVDLKLKPQKHKRLKVNSRNNEALRVRESMVVEVDSFTYLGHK